MTCFPGESDAYRAARDELLEAETELRASIQKLAEARSRLPLGGPVPEDYLFERMRGGEVEEVRLSERFADGQPRRVDLIWPLWNLFDLTPEGRGTDWYPKLAY